MSKELLAKVAFAAMNGDGELAQMSFEEYCDENNIEYSEPKCDLESVAKKSIGIVSGELEEDSLHDIAIQFGYDIKLPEEVPNEDKTMEEERAESYNESVQQ